MMNTPTHRIERLLCALFVLTPLAAVAQMAAPAPVAQEAAGTAATPTAARSAVGTGQVLSLPGGGRVWATEDPANLSPQMNVSASGIAGLRDDQVVEGLSFNVSNNYAHFIERMELLVYAGRDTDLVRPLVRLPVPVSGEGVVQWDGRLPAGHRLRPGDTLVYLVRAYGRGGQADETQARTVRL